MDALPTFTGFHDPYFKGLIDKEEQPGPILSILSARSFNNIFLFDTQSTKKITQESKQAIINLYPGTKVDVLELDDPTNYQEIINGVRGHIQAILENLPNANHYIAVASGTPQMHACWVLLAAAGEIPAAGVEPI